MAHQVLELWELSQREDLTVLNGRPVRRSRPLGIREGFRVGCMQREGADRPFMRHMKLFLYHGTIHVFLTLARKGQIENRRSSEEDIV